MLSRLRIPIAVAIAALASLVAGGGVASAAAWQTPKPLNLSNSSAASAPSVGVDAVGNAVATWQTNPASGVNVIQATHHVFGGFGFAQLPDVANDPSPPFNNTGAIVAMNRAGQGLIAWVHDLNSMGNTQVEMRTLSPGGVVGPVQTISVPAGAYTHLAAAVAPNGDAVVAWVHNASDVEAVTRQGVGGAFSSQATLDTAATDGPSVAIDQSGNALAIWPTNALAGALFSKRHPAGGSWSALSDSILTGGHTYTNQALSSNQAGQAVVAFQDSQGGNTVVDAVAGTVAAGFGSSPTVHTLSGNGVQHGPGVNIDNSGRAVVGWTTGSAVQYSQHPGGASFPPPGGVQSITPTPVTPANFELAGNGRGDVIAAWYGFEVGPNHNVARAAVLSAGSAGFGASQIISDPTKDTYDEVIALDEKGDAVVGLPLGSTGSPLGVEAVAYDGAPPVLGAPHGPVTLAAGTPGAYSVSAPDAFSGVTVRWSFGDGSAAAVGSSVTHTFTHTGHFTVTVTATDTAGNQASTHLTVAVTAKRPNCVVPKLKGKTLSQARTLLGRAHCSLGKVNTPKPRKNHKLGKLIVASSSPGAGKVRPNGTKVSLTLKEAPKPKPKHKH